MKALRCMIVPVIAATLLIASVSQLIPFTEALLCIINFVYFDLMARYHYHTDTTIEYMENYLEQFQSQKDVSVDAIPVNLYRRSRNSWKINRHWTNRRNGEVTLLGTIFPQLQSVLASFKIKRSSTQKLDNMLSTNLILPLWRFICWTTSLTISASLATSSM